MSITEMPHSDRCPTLWDEPCTCGAVEVNQELANLRSRVAELELCITNLIPLMEMAFDAEGDTFGMSHNDAVDALLNAETLVPNR